MEFNREEKSLLVMGLLALQEVTDKSKSEDFDKQKFDSDFLQDHKITIKNTYINATNNEQQKEKKSPDTQAVGSHRDNGSQM